MAVSEESQYDVVYRTGLSLLSKSKMQSILTLFLCLYYLTKKQSDTEYKKAPVECGHDSFNIN